MIEYKCINVIKEIPEQLEKINYVGDFTDIGNEIGIVIGKYICNQEGFTKQDFVSGLEHGISLSDGTH